jgi:arylsulfatase A-like enzyme
VVGEDLDEITNRAIAALRDWEPHFLMVVYYAADTMGHLFGPEADETLAAIEEIDARVQKILTAYADKNFLNETVVAVAADHGMAQIDKVVAPKFIERVGALPHGRLAFSPHKLNEKAIMNLMNDERVEDVWSRRELELLGAWNPRWGENIIHLKEGLMFPHAREMAGYHGAWSRAEQQVPLILSGAGIRPSARLETCELIDIAPTLSLLLGGDVPQNAEGRVLWEILDTDNDPPVADYQRLIRERDDLLSESKQLRRDYAAKGIGRAEFLAQQLEWKTRAEANAAATKRLQKTLIAEWQEKS